MSRDLLLLRADASPRIGRAVVAAWLSLIIRHARLRGLVSKVGRSLVDGQGAARVASLLRELR